MTYEVQTYTLCDGWVNTWYIEHPDGTSEPETFSTRAAAQAALDEFLDEIAAEIACGQRHPDEDYDREEFCIAKVGVP